LTNLGQRDEPQPDKIFVADGPFISTIFEVVKNRLDAYGEIHSTIDKSIAAVREALHISPPPDMLQNIVDFFAGNRGAASPGGSGGDVVT